MKLTVPSDLAAINFMLYCYYNDTQFLFIGLLFLSAVFIGVYIDTDLEKIIMIILRFCYLIMTGLLVISILKP